MTKIIFMGTPEFSVGVLTMLYNDGYEILAVVTQPDRPVGRKRVLTPPPVKEEALRLGLPVIQPEKLKGSVELQEILELQPDLIVTAAFGQLLPNELLEAPKLGCINVHASLLPNYRGGAPIHQAVMDGKKETGVTIMYMAEKLDAGDIISQVTTPIEETDDTGTMFTKLSIAGTTLLKETLPSIIEGTNERTVQDETQVTFARNISREQERIDWTSSALSIYNQVRGLHPWPVAYTKFAGDQVKIWWTQVEEQVSDAMPGEIIGLEKDRIIVQTGEGSLAITDLQPAGKKRMTATVFLNGIGSKWQVGDKFE
ncbi:MULTISPECIES: methionyl-tRNA formyltransferase [unclassified Sporosarcina]|uniref:methionyl-tRNA formyltransferase n=1 Tax=unclassified Sporosarcina TaxID=2647733 RepID=UPI000C164D2C|nr:MULTISPECIES: methionyl-tRNA formyltransferase [unclassified Sporosarcina]PID00120.1 methionyl-tRNA formyltransferase [Sporosarcina sp. P29]PID06802.1 methionyl-tRNA formyltransferase [Sporosarcina sp. P30]PID09997.1 methionyl-tRNA formyltransferase [Sporosarcina sp. P31]PID13576.1 methionyl-tRNA formyltransferase [Sporosarcina sp. P32b]